MRLLRIQAERFGSIDGRSLGDLSPSLTVVEGPNEAGKSSFTALVRHVLYGFPTPASEGAYLSAAGKRLGRLVFGDASGEWIVERGEGAHGGPVAVRTVSGLARDRLVEDLTSGVSANAYKVVFGFGLSEMDQIAGAKGREDDVLAQLYAASAGLGVSLSDVRNKWVAEAEELWKPRGSATRLNSAKTERDRLRAELRGLEAEGEALRADLARFESVEAGLEAARARRTATQVTAERIARAVADAERLMAEAEKAAADSEESIREAAEARENAARIGSDQAALAAGDTVDALVEGLSGFREQVGSIAGQRGRLAALDARLRSEVEDTGWTEELALAAASDAGVGVEIETARETLTKAHARVDIARSAVDAAPAAPAASDVTARAGRSWRMGGVLVAALGAVGAVAGFALAATTLPTAGSALLIASAVLAVAGVVLFLVSPKPSGGGRSAEDGRTGALESELASAVRALDEARSAWAARVRARGLGDGTEDPSAIAARYAAARALRAGAGERALLVAEIAGAQEGVSAYVTGVAAGVSSLLGLGGSSVTEADVPEIVGRARTRVVTARAAAAAAAGAVEAAERAESAAAEAASRAQDATVRAAAALASAGAPGGGLEGARELEVEARTIAEDAAEEFDRLSRESAGLRARLDADRRNDAAAELRLSLATLGESIAAGVEKYAVLSMAVRLLTLAKEKYERDRQPEVMLRAGDALAKITNGRYDRIAAALDTDAIEVFDAASGAHAPRLLSRGTAEQVYLALRIGLIDQLGAVGADLPVLMDDVIVNFSPERAERAAHAIADLATRRQVIYFTCHPATADLLCAIDPAAARLVLDAPG
jgi:uncharacterized protein YhaN